MIQRIQSVYLLVVAILWAVLLLSPAIDIFAFNQPATATTFALYPILNVFEIVIVLLALISIFFYKKRLIQIKLVLFNIVLMIGYYLLAGLFIYLINNSGDLNAELNFGIVFPAISIILSWLAFRAIRKDENLVRAADRIR